MRHLALWKEIPTATEWLKSKSTKQISNRSGFPSGAMRRLARGNFSITEIAKKCARGKVESARHFWLKWSRLAISFFRKNTVQRSHPDWSECERTFNRSGWKSSLGAAVARVGGQFEQTRLFVRTFARMGECCWYNTNFKTLFRYGVNILARFIRNPEPELVRVLQNNG